MAALLHTLHSRLFSSFFFYFFTICYGSSGFELTRASEVMVPVPPVYREGFQGRAFFATAAGDGAPYFRSALSVEAVDGRYSCSLVVLLDGVKVWASDHASAFEPVGRCAVEMTRNGNLRLIDSRRAVGWTSKTSGKGVQRLQLLETGDLLLLDVKNRTMWQSYDHPTNIILRNQVLRAPSALTFSITNSTYFYSFEVRNDRIGLYLNSINARNYYRYWELKPDKQQNITFAKLGLNGLGIFGTSPRNITQLKSTSPEPVRFLQLGSNGLLELYHYSPHIYGFQASYQAPDRFCDLPFPCGPSGICTYTNSCSCMQFSWIQYASAPNCMEGLTANGYCGLNNMVVEMKELAGASTVLRTPSLMINATSKDQCASSCIGDCSCMAALYDDDRSGGGNGCFHYGLVGGVQGNGNRSRVTYWVKVPKVTDESDGTSEKVKRGVVIAAGVVDGVAICFVVGVLMYYFCVIRKRTGGFRPEDA